MDEILKVLEAQIICVMLGTFNGSISMSAEALGMKRSTLSEKIRRYEIDINEYRVVNDLKFSARVKRFVDDLKKQTRTNAFGVRKKDDEPQDSLRSLVLSHTIKSLEANQWNKTKTARYLGINARTLDRYILEAASLGYDVKKNGDVKNA